LSLATGALALPILFIRQFLGVPEGKPIRAFLTSSAWLGWFCLGLTILLGLAYSWVSIKWVKSAFDEPTSLSPLWLECCADVLFVLMMIAFLVGVGAMAWFLVNV